MPFDLPFQVVLLLLLAEAMASKHVPLNQTPEYDTHRWFLVVPHLRWLIDDCIRENTMMSATAVFNLMSLACARSGHYKVVTDMFERSLRFCPKVGLLQKQKWFLIIPF